MNYAKLTALITFAIMLTLSVCLAKTSEDDSKKAEVTSESNKADIQGGATGSESAGSDFDIEQLLKLIDALKNQKFDEIDESLKKGGDKLMNEKDEKGKSIADMIKEDEAKMEKEKDDKGAKSSSEKASSKKSEEEFDDRFEL